MKRSVFQSGGASILAIAVALAPLPSYADQAGSQSTAGSTSSLASMLSSAVSVVSMAAGALSVSKGVKEMSCCTSGCSTGAGADAAKAKTGVTGAANGAASAVSGVGHNRVDPSLFRRFPDSARASPLSGQGKLGLFIQLFRAREAQATGCLDAALALATGGLMMLTGIMGMMSAKQAAANADTANANAAGMDNLAGLTGSTGTAANVGTGTTGSGTSSTLGSSSVGGPGTSNAAGIKIDPALLRNGKADAVMSSFENQFGIPRDQFADAVANGQDPRALLADAPSNPISADDMNKATNAANNMSASEKSAATDASGMNDIQKELAARLAANAGDNTYAAGGAKASGASHSRTPASLEDLGLGDTGPGADPSGPAKLSPEIKAALAAREEAAGQKSYFDTSLFDVVHKKYKEKTTMISGAGINKGVAGANGF